MNDTYTLWFSSSLPTDTLSLFFSKFTVTKTISSLSNSYLLHNPVSSRVYGTPSSQTDRDSVKKGFFNKKVKQEMLRVRILFKSFLYLESWQDLINYIKD